MGGSVIWVFVGRLILIRLIFIGWFCGEIVCCI